MCFVIKQSYFMWFFFNWRKTALQCMLVSAVQQLESVIITHTHTSPLSLEPLSPSTCFAPLQVITEHQAEFPVLHRSFPLAICFTHDSIYMSMLLTQFIPPSPSPLSVNPTVLIYPSPSKRFSRPSCTPSSRHTKIYIKNYSLWLR